MPIPRDVAVILSPMRWPDPTVTHLVSLVSLVSQRNVLLMQVGTIATLIEYDNTFLCTVKTEDGKCFKTYPHYFAKVRSDFVDYHRMQTQRTIPC